MRIKGMLAAAVLAALLPGAVLACGVCIEDRVAAVFDSASVNAAVAKKRHVAFFGIEGELPATAESRKAVLDALYAGGGVRGTGRVSLESASASAAFDPARTSLETLRADADKRLAARGLKLTAFRIVDGSGVLREP
jgi:hypothetical protein